jgi:AraC-like DNA-binding protein
MASYYAQKAIEAEAGQVLRTSADSSLYCVVRWIAADGAYAYGEYGKSLSLAKEILAFIGGGASHKDVIMRCRALTMIAECESELKHIAEAERLFLQCVAILMESTQYATGYEDIDPLIYALLSLNDLYIDNHMPDKALPLIAKMDTAIHRLERCSDETDWVLQMRRNNAMISQAMVYAANGQRDKAETLYLRHRQTEGLSHTDIFVEGRYLAMTDRYDEAIRLYRQSDSIYRAAGGSLSSAYINARMSLEYDALQKAGRMAEALALGNRIRMLSDSVRIQERRADMEQQKEIKRQEAEIIDKRHALTVHRIILVAAILVCLLIAWLLWRSYQYNKVLAAKNRKLYEEIEQRRQEEQQEMAQLQAAPEEQLTADQQLFRRLCTLMDEQKPYTDETLNRDSLARLLGTNAKYVEQAIRQCSKGETVGDFINRYRLERVAYLLKNTDDSIAVIGEMCGIPSRSTLARLFRNAYGMTPTEYRKI